MFVVIQWCFWLHLPGFIGDCEASGYHKFPPPPAPPEQPPQRRLFGRAAKCPLSGEFFKIFQKIWDLFCSVRVSWMLSSSSIAWLKCAKMATGKDTVLTRSTRIEEPQRGAFKRSLDGLFGRGHSGWLVIGGLPSHSRCPHSAWTTKWQETHLCHKGSRSRWKNTEKVCEHVANPCYRDKVLEDVIARKSCPLQWVPSVEMASFWPTLKRFKNAGLDASGRFSGRVSGRASGRLSGRHVGPSNLSWPEGGKRFTKQRPKIVINWSSKQTPICGWKVQSEIRKVCRFENSTPAKQIPKLWATPACGCIPSFFHFRPTINTNRCFKAVRRNRTDQGILKNHGWLWEPLLHCHVAERQNFSLWNLPSTPQFSKKNARS